MVCKRHTTTKPPTQVSYIQTGTWFPSQRSALPVAPNRVGVSGQPGNISDTRWLYWEHNPDVWVSPQPGSRFTITQIYSEPQPSCVQNTTYLPFSPQPDCTQNRNLLALSITTCRIQNHYWVIRIIQPSPRQNTTFSPSKYSSVTHKATSWSPPGPKLPSPNPNQLVSNITTQKPETTNQLAAGSLPGFLLDHKPCYPALQSPNQQASPYRCDKAKYHTLTCLS